MARLLRDEPELKHQVEPGPERTDVSEITARNDDDVGDFPVELLNNLNRDRLLPFEPETVHGVGEVDSFFGREAFDNCHTAIEVRVESENLGAVGQGLHKLGGGDFASWKNDDCRNTACRRVRGEAMQRCRRSTRRPPRGSSVRRQSFAGRPRREPSSRGP